MKKIVSISFVVLIALPLLFFAPKAIDEEISVTEFETEFSFRDGLVYINSLIDVNLFASSTTEKVIVGEDFWLFLTQSFRVPELLEEDFDNISMRIFDLRERVEAEDVKFIFVLVPDKKTVYSEKVSAHLRPLLNNNYARAVLKMELIDLAAIFVEMKEKYGIYTALETHWNRLGAFVAFSEIMFELDFEVLEYDGVDFYEREADLSRMIGLNEVEQTLMPVFSFEANKNNEKVLVYYDSFGEGLIPYFDDYFSGIESRHILQNSPFDLTDEEISNFDVVVIEIVERDLFKLLDSEHFEKYSDLDIEI